MDEDDEMLTPLKVAVVVTSNEVMTMMPGNNDDEMMRMNEAWECSDDVGDNHLETYV